MSNNEQVNAHISEMRSRVEKAWAEKAASPELTGYPSDTQDILKHIRDLWGLRIPQVKKQRGYWIMGARELIDAAGPRWKEVLNAVYAEWQLSAQKNGGIPKLTISSPKSLVEMCRAKEAMLDKPQEMSAMARRELEARKRLERE